MTDGWDDETEIFTWKGKDYVDAEHDGSILLTQKCVDDNNIPIAEWMRCCCGIDITDEDERDDWEDEIEDGYHYLLSITNVTIHPWTPELSQEFDESGLETEVTLAFNNLPINLLDLEGAEVHRWFDG